MFRNRFIVGFTTFCFLMTHSIPARSQTNASATSRSTFGLSVAEDLKSVGASNEFVAGKFDGAVMIRVNVWGGVRQPGIYHVPVGTDLITLLSFAGGPSSIAELSDTRIKRITNSKEEVLKVDVDDMLKGKLAALNIGLRVNDIVLVPEDKPFVSQNTILLLTVITMAASIAVSSIVISRGR